MGNVCLKQNQLVRVTVSYSGYYSRPPPPPTSVDQGGTYAYFLSQDTPYLRKTGGSFYRLFHIISIPFLGNFSHLTPYLGNCMVTPIPFLLFYFIFFGLGKYVYISYHYPRGFTTDIQYNKGPTLFSWEAIEGLGNMCI